jgi:hypothetical protein
VLALNNDVGPPPGVTAPGSWYEITCTAADGTRTTQTLWISNTASTATAPPPTTPAVDPLTVARQAANALQLPDPTPSFDPSGSAVVNLPTWLWIDGSIWHRYSVTASVGTVTATAVATPVSVVWAMGDGQSVTCPGPGTPYQVGLPPSAQRTDCTFTYPVSSVGQPSPNGDPNQGAFAVEATVEWAISWTATGAPGGGSLPGATTSTRTALRVVQVESVNS